MNNSVKSADITDPMLSQIEKITGTAVKASDISVFEAIVLNTKPISKQDSIFDGATMSADTLRQMAVSLNSGEESVPLHTLHQQGYELPIGRVFKAEVINTPDGSTELRSQFFLPNSEAKIIEKVNLGVLDEVSVGVKSKQMLCSKCGFDYLGPDATMSNFWDQTCANDHTIGNDGTHIQMVGLDKWMELSLISRGAASHAKILGRTKQVMGQDTYDRIAASGTIPEAVVLFSSATKKEPEPMATEENTFDVEAAFAALEEKLKAPAPVEDTTKLDALQAEFDALKADLQTANDKVQELEAAANEKPPVQVVNVPVGGLSAAAETDAEKPSMAFPAGAFKTRK